MVDGIRQVFSKVAKGAMEMAGRVSAYCGDQRLAVGRAMHVIRVGMTDESNMMKLRSVKVLKALNVAMEERMQSNLGQHRNQKPIGP